MENKEKIEVQFKTDVNEEIKKNEFIQSVKKTIGSDNEIDKFLKEFGDGDLTFADSLTALKINVEKLKDGNVYKDKLLTHIDKAKDINEHFENVIEKIKGLTEKEEREGNSPELEASIRELYRQKIGLMKELTNGVDLSSNIAVVKPQAMQRALEGEDMDVILENEVYLKTENNMNFVKYQVKKDQELDKLEELKESAENKESFDLYRENSDKVIQRMEEKVEKQLKDENAMEDPNKELELEMQRRRFS